MKMILLFLLVPVFGYSQWVEVPNSIFYNTGPQPEISITRVELKKDTLFVYQHVRHPPHVMSTTQRWYEYNERQVYVVGRGREIVFVAVERAKIRKVKVDADEEYW